MCQVSMSTMNVLIACRDLTYNGVLFYNDNLPVVIFQITYMLQLCMSLTRIKCPQHML